MRLPPVGFIFRSDEVTHANPFSDYSVLAELEEALKKRKQQNKSMRDKVKAVAGFWEYGQDHEFSEGVMDEVAKEDKSFEKKAAQSAPAPDALQASEAAASALLNTTYAGDYGASIAFGPSIVSTPICGAVPSAADLLAADDQFNESRNSSGQLRFRGAPPESLGHTPIAFTRPNMPDADSSGPKPDRPRSAAAATVKRKRKPKRRVAKGRSSKQHDPERSDVKSDDDEPEPDAEPKVLIDASKLDETLHRLKQWALTDLTELWNKKERQRRPFKPMSMIDLAPEDAAVPTPAALSSSTKKSIEVHLPMTRSLPMPVDFDITGVVVGPKPNAPSAAALVQASKGADVVQKVVTIQKTRPNTSYMVFVYNAMRDDIRAMHISGTKAVELWRENFDSLTAKIQARHLEWAQRNELLELSVGSSTQRHQAKMIADQNEWARVLALRQRVLHAKTEREQAEGRRREHFEALMKPADPSGKIQGLAPTENTFTTLPGCAGWSASATLTSVTFNLGVPPGHGTVADAAAITGRFKAGATIDSLELASTLAGTVGNFADADAEARQLRAAGIDVIKGAYTDFGFGLEQGEDLLDEMGLILPLPEGITEAPHHTHERVRAHKSHTITNKHAKASAHARTARARNMLARAVQPCAALRPAQKIDLNGHAQIVDLIRLSLAVINGRTRSLGMTTMSTKFTSSCGGIYNVPGTGPARRRQTLPSLTLVSSPWLLRTVVRLMHTMRTRTMRVDGEGNLHAPACGHSAPTSSKTMLTARIFRFAAKARHRSC